MNIKYILIGAILFSGRFYSSQPEKKQSYCELFKPHPETTLSAVANALFLLGQDYTKNTNLLPSSETINTIAWSTGAMYFSGLLAKIRKHYKQKKENARLLELNRQLINHHEYSEEIENKDKKTISIEISSDYNIEKPLDNDSIKNKINILLNDLQNNTEFASTAMIYPDDPEEIYDFLLTWKKEHDEKKKKRNGITFFEKKLFPR